MKTIEGSHEFGYELSDGIAEDIQKIEEMVRKKVCIGNQVTTTKLVDELETSKFSKGLIERALQNMIKNDEMKELRGRKMLTRIRWSNPSYYHPSYTIEEEYVLQMKMRRISYTFCS